MTETTAQWKPKGTSKTSEIANTKRKEIKTDIYYVIVGFEVNDLDAYVNEVHDLGKGYGHAFFYVVKNSKVTRMFSFGPAGDGKAGWFDQGGMDRGQTHPAPNLWNTGALIKDGAASTRPGTPDYRIDGATRLFKISLTQATYDKLLVSTDYMRGRIQSGAEKYTAWLNDTCAETSRDVLISAGIANPEGSGKVKNGAFSIPSAVNPYKWHDNFKKAGFKEVRFEMSTIRWKTVVGTTDPVAGEFRME
jgi:hypothetical protein